MEGSVNKKEYLKKYTLGIDKKKKRKKISVSTIIKSKIIDDDIDITKMRPVNELELDIYDLAEDAPQIAGIIDDRPDEVKMSEYKETKKWKIVTREYEDVHVSALTHDREELHSSVVLKKINDNIECKERKVVNPECDSDASPERTKRSIDSKRGSSSSSDASPPRKRSVTVLKKRQYNTPVGETPHIQHRPKSKGSSPDSDPSPPRKNRRRSSYDVSPVVAVKKHDPDSDASPTRKHRQRALDSDTSPPRKTRHRSLNSHIPPIRKVRNQGSDSDNSPQRVHKPNRTSYERKNRNGDDKQQRKRLTENKNTSSTSSRTLEGKKSGLQNAEELKREVAEIRRREAENMSALSESMSGKGAAPVMRDKKTGRKRDHKEEARIKRLKDEEDAERTAQYSVWGKGVKQVDEKVAKMKEDQYEMSKPFARYVDDVDLEEMQKNEEYDDDPMIDYIRSKRRKEGKADTTFPQYQGSYMPNRFNIRPGHKWDGVDRSNGYEKKWFEEKNAKRARDEEAFKWSTEDM